jgi:hypothetical protein
MTKNLKIAINRPTEFRRTRGILGNIKLFNLEQDRKKNKLSIMTLREILWLLKTNFPQGRQRV